MADPKAKKVDDEFLTWLKDNPPPEDITVVLEYGDGKKKLFHFKRSMEAYDRYFRELSRAIEDEDVSRLAIGSMFLVDSVAKEERDALGAFMAAYPGRVMIMVNNILAVYLGDFTVEVKNASTPAGQQ